MYQTISPNEQKSEYLAPRHLLLVSEPTVAINWHLTLVEGCVQKQTTQVCDKDGLYIVGNY